MALFTLSVFPDIIGSPIRQHYRLRSHKRRIRGESGRLNHDYYRFHLSQIVIITVETRLAFRLGIRNGPHVAGAYLAFESEQLVFNL